MDQTVNLTSLTSVVRIYLFPPPKSDTPTGRRFLVEKGNCRSAASAVLTRLHLTVNNRYSVALLLTCERRRTQTFALPYRLLSRRDAPALCAGMYLFPL